MMEAIRCLSAGRSSKAIVAGTTTIPREPPHPAAAAAAAMAAGDGSGGGGGVEVRAGGGRGASGAEPASGGGGRKADVGSSSGTPLSPSSDVATAVDAFETMSVTDSSTVSGGVIGSAPEGTTGGGGSQPRRFHWPPSLQQQKAAPAFQASLEQKDGKGAAVAVASAPAKPPPPPSSATKGKAADKGAGGAGTAGAAGAPAPPAPREVGGVTPWKKELEEPLAPAARRYATMYLATCVRQTLQKNPDQNSRCVVAVGWAAGRSGGRVGGPACARAFYF